MTTYRATPRLLKVLPRCLPGWDALVRLESAEVLVLKSRKDGSGRASSLEYRETAKTRRMRNQLRRINRFLSTAPFWIEPDAGQFGLTKEALPIDPTRRTLRRIFNNASWFEGGRLFDGFWESMRSADRHRLRIATRCHPEGEPVCNVDYGQLFPCLAYIKARSEPPEGDLYGFGDEDGWARDGCKRVMNAMLLAERPLRNWPEGTARLFPEGTRFKDVVAAVRRAHPKLTAGFDQGQGLTLMHFESGLLIRVLQRLYHQGIVALPLHDSVLVGRSEAQTAKTAMEDAFEEFGPTFRARVRAA